MNINKRNFCNLKLDALNEAESGILLYQLMRQTESLAAYCEPAQQLMAADELNVRHIVDRSLCLDMGFPYAVLTPIPAVPSQFTDSFEALCDLRAQAIIKLAKKEERVVTVLYSGGIDSTGVLCALLRHEIPRQYLQVVLTQRSIDEYPWFWEKTVRHLPHQLVTVINEADYSQALIVSGSLGDQLFGLSSGYLLPADQPVTLSRFLTPAIIEWLTPWLERSPIPVKTNLDFVWWLRFSLSWQHAELTIIRKIDMLKHSLEWRHFIDFYGTDEFQRWAIVNHDLKIKDTWETYKFPIKDYIFSYTQDKDYRDHKVKECSLRYAYSA